MLSLPLFKGEETEAERRLTNLPRVILSCKRQSQNLSPGCVALEPTNHSPRSAATRRQAGPCADAAAAQLCPPWHRQSSQLLFLGPAQVPSTDWATGHVFQSNLPAPWGGYQPSYSRPGNWNQQFQSAAGQPGLPVPMGQFYLVT